MSARLTMNGLCECGCGRRTKRASRTRTSEGCFKGQYLRYIKGHNGQPPSRLGKGFDPDSAFRIARLRKGFPSPCWIWTRALNKPGGYGRFGRNRKHHLAHVWFYEKKYGPLPRGRELD